MFLEKAAFLKAKPSIAVTIRKYLLRLRDVPWWNSGTQEDRCTQREKKKNSVKTYTGSSSILLNKHHRVILCLWKKKKERKQPLKKIGHQRNLITPAGLFYKGEMLTWQLGRRVFYVFYGAFSLPGRKVLIEAGCVGRQLHFPSRARPPLQPALTPWLEVPHLKFMCLVGIGKKCPGDQLLWGTNAATDLTGF